MGATIKVSNVIDDYSVNMDSYSNNLSLDGISGPGGVNKFISRLNNKLVGLQTSITDYTSHINKAMSELNEIEDTISRSFESRLSDSAAAANLLSNNFGVTVDGVFYGFDESNPVNSRFISAINKIMKNKIDEKDDILDGLTEGERELLEKEEYSSLVDHIKTTDVGSLLSENAYLKKESHSLEDLVKELKILNQNEYVESTARENLKNKGYSSKYIDLLIQFKNDNALDGWHTGENEYYAKFSEVFYDRFPGEKPPENLVIPDGEQKVEEIETTNFDEGGNNNENDGGNTGTGAPAAGEQNQIDFRQVDLTDHNFHLAPDELNLENANNKVYIQLDSNATLDEISKAYGGISYKYIKRYYPETGQTDVISDPQMVFKDAYYVIDVSDIQ